MPFKINPGYYLHVFFKEKTDLYSHSKTTDKLAAELQELLTIYRENFNHGQEL